MILRAIRLAVLSAALAAAAGACAPRTPPPSPAADGVRWSRFHWVSATLAGRHYDHVAIYVPIASPELGGRHWLQLDTGAESGFWIYRAPLSQLLARRGVRYDSTQAV